MNTKAFRRCAFRTFLRFLDATTRSWPAFWGTLIAWVIYWVWNGIAPADLRFDPYPYMLLTLIITMLSYLQNVILMTDQRIGNAKLEKVRERQDAADAHRLHLMEAVVSLCNVLIDHAERAQRRDEESIARDGRIAGMLESLTNDRSGQA